MAQFEAKAHLNTQESCQYPSVPSNAAMDTHKHWWLHSNLKPLHRKWSFGHPTRNDTLPTWWDDCKLEISSPCQLENVRVDSWHWYLFLVNYIPFCAFLVYATWAKQFNRSFLVFRFSPKPGCWILKVSLLFALNQCIGSPSKTIGHP